MSNSDWPAPDVAPQPVRYASFGMRALAHICDGLMVALIIVPITILLSVVTTQDQGNVAASATSILGLVIQSYWIGTKGGSPLRVKIGVIVVDESTGSYIGFSRGLLRTVVTNAFGILAVFNLILALVPLIDFLWMLRDPKNQTLHDKVARTIVQQS